MSRPANFSLLKGIYVLFALSGFAGLIYESLWSRYLKLLLGHSSYGQILTLMIFMGGLGLGSFLGGRWAGRVRQPLMLYAAAEGLIGLGAMFFHGLFLAMQQLLHALLSDWGLTGPGVMVLKTLLATTLTLPWALCLGVTFPALAIGLMRLRGDAGQHTLPGLYFSNSLGGALGVLCASYLLIPSFGTPGTLICAGLLNLTLAALFYLWARTDLTDAPIPAPDDSVAWSPNLLTRVLLGAALLTGLSSFLYEIGWIRLLSLIINSSTHSFDLMVAAFILGLAFGGRFARRLHNSPRSPLAILATVQVLMGLAAALSLNLYQGLFQLSNQVHLVLMPTDQAYPFYSVFKYGLCLLLMFPASFFAGTTLPLISWTLIRSQGKLTHVGQVYGWNTLGSIVGAGLGGLVLLPLIQLKGTLLVGALIDVGLGLTLFALLRPGGLKLALACGLSGLLLLPTALLRLKPYTLASGSFRYFRQASEAAQEQVDIRDGRTATISFHREPYQLSIRTNGKPDASVNLNLERNHNLDELTQMALAMYPINLLQKPYKAAMIGFGSGMTAEMLLGDPLLQRLDVIEIEPVMVAMAKGFQPYNHRAYQSPKINVIYDDAKAFLFGRRQKYDLLISEPSNPWVSGVAGLFSTEFYADIRRFLTSDGMLVQWIHGYEFSDELLLSILKGLQDNFAELAVYGVPTLQPGHINSGDLVILASQKPMNFPPLLRNLPLIDEDLQRIQVHQHQFSGAMRLVTGRTLKPYLDSLNPNSDFFPLVENAAERCMYTKSSVGLFDFLLKTPWPYQRLFEADYAEILNQRQLNLQAEYLVDLNALDGLIGSAAQLGKTDEVLAGFYGLTQKYFELIDFDDPVLQRLGAFFSLSAPAADQLEFELLKAVKADDRPRIEALSRQLTALPATQLQLGVIRTLAVRALQRGDLAGYDRVLKQLALPHPQISRTEQLYLLALQSAAKAR